MNEVTVDIAATFFESAGASALTLHFRQIGALFGHLPAAAWSDDAWWTREHEWSPAWLAFGREVESVDTDRELVRFSPRRVEERSPHETVTMTCPFTGASVQVDAMLAPLISEVWRHGWRTNACCERSTGLEEASISFMRSMDAFDFIDAARPAGTPPRSWRIVVRSVPGDDVLRAHVYFPATDVEQAYQRLCAVTWCR